MERAWKRIGCATAGIAAFLIVGCASAPKAPPQGAMAVPSPRVEETSGVEVVSLRETAAGRMLDFRYRVVDPEKAAVVLDRGTPAYLIDGATGARMEIPETKVGRMRQNTRNPEKGRTYFMLFNTAGRRMSPGDKVTVVVGEHRFENLTVQ